MKKIFGILFALLLVVSLGLGTAAPILAEVDWTDIKQVDAHGSHVVGLKTDGTVVAVGDNFYGQCNVGDWTDIIQVDAGVFYTVGLKSDGTVVAVGWNEYGQCGVGGWANIKQLDADAYHTVGLKNDGTVVAVGRNSEGQCDVADWTVINQTHAGGLHTVGLKNDGTVVAVGDNSFGQCNVGGWTDIIQVDGGGFYTVGLKSDGTVVAVGYNDYGQCNVGGWTDIIQVDGGVFYTVGLKSDGTVVAVGDNSYGQCNVGGWMDIVQVAAGKYHTVGLKSDGTVVTAGNAVTETVTNDTVDAKAEADTEVEVDGTATVTVARYEDNPGGPPPTDFSSLDKYIDVYVPDTTEANELEIRLYYTDAELAATGIDEESLRLFWWDGDDWVACSDSGVNTASTNHYSGYMWARIRNDTTPPLEQLQGTEWGGYGHPSEPPQPLCFIATAAYGSATAQEIDILRELRVTILLADGLGARFVSLYYRTSPPIASFISQHEMLRILVRVGFVDPIIDVLNCSHDLWSSSVLQ